MWRPKLMLPWTASRVNRPSNRRKREYKRPEIKREAEEESEPEPKQAAD